MSAVTISIIGTVFTREVLTGNYAQVVGSIQEGFMRGVDARIDYGNPNSCTVQTTGIRAAGCTNGVSAGGSTNVPESSYFAVK